jgi:hypothetical protein
MFRDHNGVSTMKPLYAIAMAWIPVIPLTWAESANAQAQTVLVGGNPVITGKDVAPAGASYSVPKPNIAEAVIAVAQQGSQAVGIVHGPYNALASGMSAFGVNNAVVRNTGNVCALCRPQGGVGIAQFKSNFFLAFPDPNAHIHLRTWTPQTWPSSNPSDIDLFSVDSGAQTTYAPSLLSFNGSLVLAFRDDNNHLHVWSSALGDFSDLVKINDLGGGQQSDWAPGIARMGGSLILARQVGDPGCLINCKNPDMAVSIGPGFNPEVDFSNASMDNAGPGALGFGTNLFFSWRGQGNRNISFTQMTLSQLNAKLGSTTGTPNPVTVLSNGEQSEHTPNLASIGDAESGFTAVLLWHDGSTGSTGSDGTNLLFEQVAALPPSPVLVCTTWNANYIDAMLGEDVLGGTNKQVVPAAFANFSLAEGSQQVLTGTLDKNGCADITQVALSPDGTVASPNAQWTLQLDGTFTKKLHSGAGKINLTVSSSQSLPANGLPALTEAISTTFSVSGSGTINANPTKLDPVTGVAAFVSTLLARDETDDLGLVPSSLTLFAELGCGGSSDNSCASAGNTPQLFIAPAITTPNNCPSNITIGDAHWKFVIAHEFGHVVQGVSGASLPVLYNPQIPGRPPICRCDHVTVANSLHCMQGMQRWDDAQEEGFAHFYSATIWNSRQSPTCTFEYYKEFLVANKPNLPAGDFTNIQTPPEQQNPPLASACDGLDAGLTPGNGGPSTFYSIAPPLFIDCLGNPSPPDPRSFVNYRLQAPCWTTGATDLTSEFDWLKFYTNINRNATNTPAQIPISQILGVYANVCKAPGVTCGEGTSSTPTPGQPTWDQLANQARAQLGAAQDTAFQQFGKQFGVDRNI